MIARLLIVVELALLGLLSCSGEPPPVFGIDPAFTDDEEAAIVAAARDWDPHTYEADRIVFVTRGFPWLVERADPVYPKVGRCLPGSHTIKITPGLPAPWVRVVARHEFGHALWLHHVSHGWMQAQADDESLDMAFTTDDLNECRRAGVCP